MQHEEGTRISNDADGAPSVWNPAQAKTWLEWGTHALSAKAEIASLATKGRVPHSSQVSA